MYYVYVLLDEIGRSYIGYSADVKKRLAAHNEGEVTSTRGHKWALIYYEAYRAEEDARAREKQLKNSGQGRRWLKERIVNSIALSRES